MQPRLPTKHMIGTALSTLAMHHGGDAVAGHRPGIVLADGADRLPAGQLQRPEHAEELVHIGHPAPAITQFRPIARCRGILYHAGRIDRSGHDGLRLIGRDEAVDETAITFDVGLRPQMDLVDGVTGRVEELKAAADLAVFVLFDSKAVLPHARKDPQVDVFAEHRRAVLADGHVAVDADLLVHRALVAGQRHHLADRLKPRQEFAETRFDACG